MTDDYPIYCPAQTYRATRETPAEFCENEVFEEGDYCQEHAEPDDDYAYERFKEARNG